MATIAALKSKQSENAEFISKSYINFLEVYTNYETELF